MTLAAPKVAASARFLMRDWPRASEIVSQKTEPALGFVRLTYGSPSSSKKSSSGSLPDRERMLGTTAPFSRIFWLPRIE